MKIREFINTKVLGPYFQKPVPFRCDRSGKCCRDLVVSRKRELEVIRENSGPFYRTLPDRGLKGVMIFDWERKSLEKTLKERGQKGKFEPGMVLIPKDKKLPPIVVKWLFYYSSCPFIGTDGLCGIYKERPLTCRRFPLGGIGGIFSSIRRGVPVAIPISNLCCDGEKTNLPEFFLSPKAMAEKFSAAFGECFSAKVKSDADDMVILGLQRFAEKNLGIPFEEGYLHPEGVWTLSKKGGVPISEFFIERKLLTEKQLLRAIERNRKELETLLFSGKIREIKKHKISF